VDTAEMQPLDTVAGGTIGCQVVAGTTYNDHVTSSSLQEALPTANYDTPHPETVGLKVHPGGFLVGYFDNVLCMSAQGAPHAFPLEYRKTMDYKITGITIFGTYVFVGTTGNPYFVWGNSPDAMTSTKLPATQSCVSKQGIADVGNGAVYPSPDGLIYVTGSGAKNITEGIFSRKDWQALQPETMLAFIWEGTYFCFFGDGSANVNSFQLNPSNPELGVRFFGVHATSGYKDIEEDILYLVIDGEIEAFTEGTSAQIAVWKSGVRRQKKPTNFSLAQVIADDYPVLLRLFADDVNRQEIVVQGPEIFRLVAGYKAIDWSLEIHTRKPVVEVTLANNMKEFGAME
jgi:hypothetical protein